jgi:hypothetical protein
VNLLSDGWRLTRLDWSTLRDLSSTTLKGEGMVVASADGSTLASLKGRGSTAVAIIDAASGAVRRRYQVDSSLGRAQLSADGSKLALADGASAALRWYVSDTRTGRRLATLEVQDALSELWNGDLTRGARLLVPGSGPNALHPVHPILASDDPSRGREVRRLELEEVYAGIWKSDRRLPESFPLVNGWQPGAALSADGGTMAVVYADGDRLLLVDLSRMQIRSSLTVRREQSWIERLGLHVRDVQAKGMDGWSWYAAFTPQGSLLAWGQHNHVTDQGEPVWEGLGLRLIDPGTGTILQQGLEGQVVGQVVAAPDGSAIIATTSSRDGVQTLYRLDARTLAVTASRHFERNVFPQLMTLTTPQEAAEE